MDIAKLLNGLLPVLGQAGVTALTAELQDLTKEQSPGWKKAALALLADAVEAHGPTGIELARKAMLDLLEHKVPSIDWANPRTASDVVAALQTAEAGDKTAINDFYHKAGSILGKVLAAMLQGMLA